MALDLGHPCLVLDPTAADPHGEAERLREWGGCVPVELQQGVTAWLTTDEPTARTAFAHPDLVKGVEHWRDHREGRIRDDWPLLPLVVGATMVNRDGADHDRLRGPVARAFGRRPVRDFAPRIRALVDELLDAAAGAAPGETTDLKAALAFPLPMAVICHLLGIDDPRVRAEFGEGAATLLRSTAAPEEVGAAHRAVTGLMEELIAAKEAEPGDDLTTRLLQAHREGQLSRAELLDSILLLVVAGHDTTANLITNAVRALLAHPDQLALVRSGAADWEDVVNETLRFDPPVQRIMIRFARCDVPLGGATVREGDPVIIGMTGAGRDAAVHPRPDVFDLRRRQAPNPLHFGLGPHYCVGAPLARMEAVTALQALFERFPDVAAADEPAPPVLSHIMNSPRVLPVVLVPR